MKRDILDAKFFDTRIREENIGGKERVLGYFLGPVSVVFLNSILNNYLNVYYTDVVQLGHVWNGWFLTVFPIVVKVLDALTFLLMGIIVDRFYSRQGVARPWILFSAPLLALSFILLFFFPSGNRGLMLIWIFVSYNLFYSIAYTAYNTCHTLLVPLSTRNREQRGKLSVLTNTQGMFSGMLVAVMFPTFVIPAIGISRRNWIVLMAALAAVMLPCVLLEYFYTRERVTEESRKRGEQHIDNVENAGLDHCAEEGKINVGQNAASHKRSMKEQLRLCLQSRSWTVLMIYLVLSQLTGLLASFGTFYYCNWVLGSYNDGYTQALYYAVGNAPLGLGLFLCRPVCKKFGRQNAMAGGFLLAAAGTAVCVWNPQNIKVVLAGQVLKSIGLIPSTYMVSAMLGDALDDVEEKTGVRCDGFSSSVYNIVFTLTTGVAMCILNLGLTQLGYVAPEMDDIPLQNEAVRGFFTFCTVGLPTILYPLIAVVLWMETKRVKTGKKAKQK
ncbi:MAG: MFS transporter [Lachnospiraceae bacterium]|nr:MFS transporter [Lachnospiraceae bacterium]